MIRTMRRRSEGDVGGRRGHIESGSRIHADCLPAKCHSPACTFACLLDSRDSRDIYHVRDFDHSHR